MFSTHYTRALPAIVFSLAVTGCANWSQQTDPTFGALPASFQNQKSRIDLLKDGVYLKTTLDGVSEIGRWSLINQNRVLLLRSGGETPMMFDSSHAGSLKVLSANTDLGALEQTSFNSHQVSMPLKGRLEVQEGDLKLMDCSTLQNWDLALDQYSDQTSQLEGKLLEAQSTVGVNSYGELQFSVNHIDKLSDDASCHGNTMG